MVRHPRISLGMAEANVYADRRSDAQSTVQGAYHQAEPAQTGAAGNPGSLWCRERTIGFVGFGRISRATVDSTWPVGKRGFLTTDPYVAPDTLPGGRRDSWTCRCCCAESDVVDVQVTLTKETRHMIGAAEIARMKPTAYSDQYVPRRGRRRTGSSGGAEGTTDRRRSARRLRARTAAPDHPLRELDNVILTFAYRWARTGSE